jgi:hypothetical protein
MDQVAALPRSDRAALFGETAALMGIRPVIAEKDFWVCWALKHLFGLSGDRPGMLCKGGTSLSKAYALIERFSEDIDVSLDRAFLYGGDLQDPEKATSGKQAQRRTSYGVEAFFLRWRGAPHAHDKQEEPHELSEEVSNTFGRQELVEAGISRTLHRARGCISKGNRLTQGLGRFLEDEPVLALVTVRFNPQFCPRKTS